MTHLRHLTSWMTTLLAVLVLSAAAPTAQAVRYQFTKLAETGQQFTGLGSASINNTGMVVFSATGADGRDGVYAYENGAMSQLYQAEEGISIAHQVSLNDHGSLVFGTLGSFGSDAGREMVVLVDGQVRSNGDPRFSPFLYNGTINNSGEIAVWIGGGRSVRGGLYILTGMGRVRVPTDGVTIAPYGVLVTRDPPSINNLGQVAFVAQSADADMGIFLGPHPVTDRVISTNDLLDDLEVWSLTLGKESLNDQGQITFMAQLSDGRQALFRADPIPEPTTLALTCLASLMLTMLTHRRRLRGLNGSNYPPSSMPPRQPLAGHSPSQTG